jgi:hypothetical protein
MEQSVMFNVELHNRVSVEDPIPCFATRIDVEIAELLRHRLEKRLLSPSAQRSSSTAPSSDSFDDRRGPGMFPGHEREQP